MQDLKQLLKLFDDYLQQNKFGKEPHKLYEPVDYIMSLGGKRLRPALLLMSYQVFGEELENALPAALAVEVFHNFSLVHDDIMDEAPLRRGKPSVHTKYDVNTGILSGDVMLILSYECLRKSKPPQIIPDLYRIFNQLAIGVCEGQQMDMDFETRREVSIPEYLKMIELKTAALVRGCLEMGAVIAGATAEDAHNLAEFGRNIGIAFQLQDDILDTFGDPDKVGKKVGGDIVQNKKTFLILKAKELADQVTERELDRLMTRTNVLEENKVKAVTAILKDLNVKEVAEKKKEHFQQTAFRHLAAVKGAAERKKPLERLAIGLMSRQY